MKILFAIRSPGFFRFFDRTIRHLAAQGHSLQVVCHYYRNADPAVMKAADRASQLALLRCEAEIADFRWGPALHRDDGWRRPLFASRKLLDYSSYAVPGRQASRMVIDRAAGHLPGKIQEALRLPGVRALVLTPAARRLLRRFEKLAPPHPAILDWLRRERPDVVVASPVLMTGSDEVEYIKAAACLGIPTVVAVMSWDNLTTKGVFQVIPDMTLVWNQGQVEEAVRFHDVPRDQVVSTGAPVFDEWFGMQPTLARAAFCREAGLDPARPYALYLCSSWSIARDETSFVEAVAQALQRHPATSDIGLLVRPHPSNANIWEGHTAEPFAIWPRSGALPATDDARQAFYHSLVYSIGALGINTSSLIETAIVDRPCLTILAERYRDTQQSITHFQHLLNASFLEVAPDIPAAAEALAGLLRGEDNKREARRRFVRDFVRPWGLERSAGQITALVIEATAQRRSPEQLRALMGAEPAAQPAESLLPVAAP